MRVICAAAIAAMLAGPVYGQSQAKAPPGAPAAPPKSQRDIAAEAAAQRAYQNSLRAIPDQPAADPWGGARSLEAPKVAAKPTVKRVKDPGAPN